MIIVMVMLIMVMTKIMNVEYICLTSLNAMQIKISFAVAVISISRYAQHVPQPADLDPFLTPARPVDFWPCPSPPREKKLPCPSLVPNQDQKQNETQDQDDFC